ncbi:hypothetical protein GCM10007304_48030 [Rhodococcoides trifolii]|uniref:Nucleotidyl transferase AbiEii/AbiGii toxin family protein n=1 Tax=Rhodococcoides trifolii TaxID=908250 RepID=A0A917LIX8_9NOCA|nr:nucleotidyl transferase AbiEii/AbiGii toxin family protein [Rhodococcus trifolii]GGG28558.1 hypothetical protein GCM10007304_48030 [Rhodococcus trifolii]
MLTDFQTTVAHLFFTLPAIDGFLLAGGAALLAQQMTTRPTQDLDFFTSRGQSSVIDARDQFEHAAHAQGWTVDRIHDTDTFCRLLLHGPEDLLIDLALDSPPGMPATASIAGPTFAPDELAGRKLVALFDRAEARDFADVHTLTTHYDKNTLLSLAADVDTGFDHGTALRRTPFLLRDRLHTGQIRSPLGRSADRTHPRHSPLAVSTTGGPLVTISRYQACFCR